MFKFEYLSTEPLKGCKPVVIVRKYAVFGHTRLSVFTVSSVILRNLVA